MGGDTNIGSLEHVSKYTTKVFSSTQQEYLHPFLSFVPRTLECHAYIVVENVSGCIAF